ncbi:hypothetical protein SAMN05428988_0371 [Chitinophaga sp. YR573]|uniref:hypothetical protein n=1 Tax=Chitinophaga sp. YR573 TaxID=1881040 RepID=UPI0008D2AA78|nr:hypothetical protein [Chitinophaga sp. YR573]SEV91150.1 hypothetical protein SAMN05428988_0371 [Chitinophaga sp. YR573]
MKTPLGHTEGYMEESLSVAFATRFCGGGLSYMALILNKKYMEDECSFSYELLYNAVFVIESLRPGDKKTGTDLHNDVIRWKCIKNGTQSQLFTVETKAKLFSLFQEIRQLVTKGVLIPILHFEMHGSERGMQLTSNEVVTWEELGELCRNINMLIKNQLIVSLATCKGAYFYKCIEISRPAPFWGYIGPKEDSNQYELLEDYTNFYTVYLDTEQLQDAIIALNVARGTNDYVFINGDIIFEILFEFMDKNYPSKIIRFHRLKHQTKAINPNMNRRQRRGKLMQNIEEHDPWEFKRRIKNQYLMK